MLKSSLLTTFSWFQLSVKFFIFAELTLFHRMSENTLDLLSKITFLFALGRGACAPSLSIFVFQR